MAVSLSARRERYQSFSWSAIRWPVMVMGILILVFLCAWFAGFRINATPSEPVGIWRMEPVTSPIRVGEFVSFCAPTPDFPFLQPGDCLNGVAPFLKEVVGGPGDRIQESAEGVWINGRHLPESRPLAKAVGYAVHLPQWRGSIRLRRGQYWVYGSGWPSLSYDSRYWGPVSRARIRSVARPVWVTAAHLWLP